MINYNIRRDRMAIVPGSSVSECLLCRSTFRQKGSSAIGHRFLLFCNCSLCCINLMFERTKFSEKGDFLPVFSLCFKVIQLRYSRAPKGPILVILLSDIALNYKRSRMALWLMRWTTVRRVWGASRAKATKNALWDAFESIRCKRFEASQKVLIRKTRVNPNRLPPKFPLEVER